MKKVLTISIAAYNVEGTLRRTLDSLSLEKPFAEKLEVIIVNDGSKDLTSEIAKEYAKKYPTIVKVIDKSNGGYGSTINSSSSVATGKYYKLLDGDDWYESENIEEFLCFLEETMADIVLSPFYEINQRTGEKNLVVHHQEIQSEETSIDGLDSRNDILMHGMTVRTDLWKGTKYRVSEHCYYSDNEFTVVALINAETISRYDIPIYCYSIGVPGQSVSVEGIAKHYEDYVKIGKRLLIYHSRNDSNDTVDTIVNNKITDIVNSLFSAYMLPSVPLEKWNELYEFDVLLKKNSRDIYKRTNRVKKIAICRMFGIVGYRIARQYLNNG